MPKLYSSRQIAKVLEILGFRYVSQSGSHGKFKNENGKTATVPMNKTEIPIGTFKSILRQAGSDLQQFKDIAE